MKDKLFFLLALPLVWLHPRYRMITKVLVTIMVVGISVSLYFIVMSLYVWFIVLEKPNDN